MKRHLVLACVAILFMVFAIGIISFAEDNAQPPEKNQPTVPVTKDAKAIFDKMALKRDAMNDTIRKEVESAAAAAHAAKKPDEVVAEINSIPELLRMPKYPICAKVYKGHHYLGIIQKNTWEEAKNICEQLGGHLLYIKDQDKANFVVANYNYLWLWIGCKKEKAGWKWIDGSEIDKSFWNKERPMQFNDRTYGFIDGGKISDANIGESKTCWAHGFVCEWDY